VTLILAAASQPVVSHNLGWTDWIVAGVIFVAGIVVGRISRVLVARAAKRDDSENSLADTIAKLIGYLAVIAGVVFALGVLGVRLGPLFGALGIGGLAIAFAAQSILANFLASIILQLRRPFRRGDQIATGDSEGIVEDVNFRTVVLRTFDGERVLVPCSSVLSNPIVNHTRFGRRRTAIDVGVSYDADLETARKVLHDAVVGVDGVMAKPEVEVWVESFGDSAINLVVRYWHKPDTATLWRVRSAVAVGIKEACDEHGIDMPFPVVTLQQPPQRR
jgi:small-conductance mechanosensitive channel